MPTRDRKKHRTTESAASWAGGILTLQRELRGRFVSIGGRPADIEPTMRRLVPVRRHVWKELQQHAALLSSLGQRVSPGQLASMLLERGVAALELRHARK